MFNHRMGHSAENADWIGSIAFAALLGVAMAAPPAHADEFWKIDQAKSHFTPGANTLVLEKASPATAGPNATASSASAGFLVLADGKVFMAVDEAALASGPGARKVDYSRWRDMKLVEIGDHVRPSPYCSLRCQSGADYNTMTVNFTAHGQDPTETMKQMVAISSR